MNFLITSFATKNTPYEQILRQYLLSSLQRQRKLNYWYTELIPDLGTWHLNTAYKAKFILDMFKMFPHFKSVVYVDADAEMLRYPTLFDEIPDEYDIACHFLSWEIWYGYTGNKTRELLTGTILLKNRPIVKDLCNEWYNEAIKQNEWEQKTLQRIITKYPIKIFELPIEYCYMITRPHGEPPLIRVDDPVFRHYQVSRTLKKRIWKR